MRLKFVSIVVLAMAISTAAASAQLTTGVNYNVYDSANNFAGLLMFNSDGTWRMAWSGAGDTYGTYSGGPSFYNWSENEPGPGWGTISWCTTHNRWEWVNNAVPTWGWLRL
jgi:hypothetical protein